MVGRLGSNDGAPLTHNLVRSQVSDRARSPVIVKYCPRQWNEVRSRKQWRCQGRVRHAESTAGESVNQQAPASKIEPVTAQLHQAGSSDFQESFIDEVGRGEEHESVSENPGRPIGS